MVGHVRNAAIAVAPRCPVSVCFARHSCPAADAGSHAPRAHVTPNRDASRRFTRVFCVPSKRSRSRLEQSVTVAGQVDRLRHEVSRRADIAVAQTETFLSRALESPPQGSRHVLFAFKPRSCARRCISATSSRPITGEVGNLRLVHRRLAGKRMRFQRRDDRHAR